MNKLTDLNKAQLRVILSYICYNEDIHTDVISILKALRDNTISKSISAVIDAKYTKLLNDGNISETMHYVGKDRKKAICMMFIHILSQSEIKEEMLDLILNCLNICYDQLEGTDELLEQLYIELIKFCKSNKAVHDFIIVAELWMKMNSEDWTKKSIEYLMTIPTKTKSTNSS